MLSYELFGNSRVGNISFTSSSTLCFGRIHLQDMICQHAACHILLRIQTFLIEIFGRGVPSPLFFRLSFLLPFNSIYTVANRKKTTGKFSENSQTIAIFAEFNSFGIDTMAHLIYFRYRKCGEVVLCPKCFSRRTHPEGKGWVFRLIEWLRKNQSLY